MKYHFSFMIHSDNTKKIVIQLIFIASIAIAHADERPGLQNAANTSTIRVKAIYPVSRNDFSLSVEQPAEIAPYYRAELYAEIAGKIVFLEKELGDTVKAGEKLAEIQPSTEKNATTGNQIIIAPFDGVVASRSVDPGTFVPSATIVPGTRPILTIERNDIVTISMKVPDTFVSLISKETIAEIRMDPLPGQVFKSKISRMAPSLASSDRTLLVQVDLFNRTKSEFELLKKQFSQTGGAELKSRMLPEFPEINGSKSSASLIPGMYGKMKLLFESAKSQLLIPASAIVRRGGVDFIYMVEGGKARIQPVKIQFDNARFVSVILKNQAGEPRPLSKDEIVIISNQAELEEGQPVEAIVAE